MHKLIVLLKMFEILLPIWPSHRFGRLLGYIHLVPQVKGWHPKIEWLLRAIESFTFYKWFISTRRSIGWSMNQYGETFTTHKDTSLSFRLRSWREVNKIDVFTGIWSRGFRARTSATYASKISWSLFNHYFQAMLPKGKKSGKVSDILRGNVWHAIPCN